MKARTVLLIAILCGATMVFTAVYWLACLAIRLPGYDYFRDQYGAKANRMGVGVPYETGPWMIAALLFFGATVLINVFRGLKER